MENSSNMIAVILTFTGLTGIFLFFRIDRVTEILLGDGNSALKRQEEGRERRRKYFYTIEPLIAMKYWRRLRDAIWRKNIYGIEEGLRRIAILEKKPGKHLGSNSYSRRVLQYFIKTRIILNCLKLLLLLSFLISICCILCFRIDYLKLYRTASIIYFISFTILVVFCSILYKTPHEKNKKGISKDLLRRDTNQGRCWRKLRWIIYKCKIVPKWFYKGIYGSLR